MGKKLDIEGWRRLWINDIVESQPARLGLRLKGEHLGLFINICNCLHIVAAAALHSLAGEHAICRPNVFGTAPVEQHEDEAPGNSP